MKNKSVTKPAVKPSSDFSNLVDIVAYLRNPDGGCPWDLAQTHQSIRPYLLEETYEVLEAVDLGEDEELSKELGDLLLQVVLHAQIARDRNAFGIGDVIERLSHKLIRRHPHVFGDTSAKNPLEASMSWEKAKLAETAGSKKDEQHETSLFAGVPKSLPALLRAHRLGEKAAHVGFDWPDISGVLDKVKEELGELQEELNSVSHTDAENKCEATDSEDARNEIRKAASLTNSVMSSLVSLNSQDG